MQVHIRVVLFPLDQFCEHFSFKSHSMVTIRVSVMKGKYLMSFKAAICSYIENNN